jgi:cytochrome c biogenesis protein
MLKRIFRALASTRLAAFLIGYLALGCALATVVPAGLGPAALGPGFFRSAFFSVPVGLFFLNLLACSAARLARVLGSPTPRRHGPDILHLGLLVFLVAAVLSGAYREGGLAKLAVGDAVELPGGEVLRLLGFTTERYGDGRPKEWTSEVRVERGGEILVADYPLRVNHPLSVEGLTVYQASHESKAVPEANSSGTTQALRQEDVSGLLVVRDSFFGLVLASLAVIILGLGLTFIQKLGDLPK